MKTLLSAFVVMTAALVVPQDSSKVSSSSSGSASSAPWVRGPVPFGVGERIEYRGQALGLTVGKASIEVMGITTLRGRPTWNVQVRVSGKVPFLYSLNDTISSWMDTSSLHSLQFTQNQVENKRIRQRRYEIFPERSVFRQRTAPDTFPEMPSVANPLDEASFLYFIRTIPLVVGRTDTMQRYFRPDRNPVIITVLRKEEVSVPLGTFPAIVIQPSIKSGGLFAEGGEAKVWISDDDRRMILKIHSKATKVPGGLDLEMTKYVAAKVPPPRR